MVFAGDAREQEAGKVESVPFATADALTLACTACAHAVHATQRLSGAGSSASP
jgi:hypothetical protein